MHGGGIDDDDNDDDARMTADGCFPYIRNPSSSQASFHLIQTPLFPLACLSMQRKKKGKGEFRFGYH